MVDSITRRSLIQGLGAVGGAAFLGGPANARWSALLGTPPADPDSPPRTLVLVQLSGGNDGLSTVIPFGDDVYHAARRSTRLESDQVLRLDDYRGLNPKLQRLHAEYGEGRMAIVEGVGYPEPNRSHFKSLDIWHAADPRGRVAGEGWIGRLSRALTGEDADPNAVVHVGANAPYSLHSTTHPPAVFAVPAGYRWVGSGDDVERLAKKTGNEPGGSGTLAALRDVVDRARDSSLAVRRAAASYRPRVDYPRSTFAETLRIVASLIQGNIGARVVSVELDGFDTHNAQASRHRGLMTELDAGLGAFLEDLRGTPAGDQTVVLAFSEFGRRVEENASGGTDHGVAGPAFLFGSGVRGGLHGKAPSLTELDSGDLVHTTDFRGIYRALVEDWFGVPADEVLPGSDVAKLALLGD